MASGGISIVHDASESTRMTGVRRGLSFGDPDYRFYPESLSNFGGDFSEVRPWVVATTPLPWSARHTLTLDARYRGILGGQGPKLEIGGAPTGSELFLRSNAEGRSIDVDGLPSGSSFFEAFRGFEDYGIVSRSAYLGTVTYRYPWVIDFGFTSIAHLLPSLFFRQVDLELFASGDTDEGQHLATGASIELDMSMSYLCRLNTRVAQRLHFDEAQPLHGNRSHHHH